MNYEDFAVGDRVYCTCVSCSNAVDGPVEYIVTGLGPNTIYIRNINLTTEEEEEICDSTTLELYPYPVTLIKDDE